MRVLAVAERAEQQPGDDLPLGSRVALAIGEPGGDGGVISGGAREGLARELGAEGECGGAAVLIHLR